MTKRLESELFGQVRLGIVDEMNTDNMRMTVHYPDSIGGARSVIANTSPMFGFIPPVNSIVAIYDKPGWEKRLLFPLSEIATDLRPEDVQVEEGEDIPGLIPRKLAPGDMYIGRNARIFLKDSGSIFMETKAGRVNLELNSETAKLLSQTNNWDFQTHGKGIRMFTKSSIPGIFGDEFLIERNVPSPGTPDFLAESIPTNISRFKISKVGNYTMEVGRAGSGDAITQLTMDILGNASLMNPLVTWSMQPTGSFSMLNDIPSGINVTDAGALDLLSVKSSLTMGLAGDIRLKNESSGLLLFSSGETNLIGGANENALLKFDASGNITLYNNAVTQSIQTDGSYSLTGPSFSSSFDSSGNFAFTSNSAYIDAGTQALFKAAIIQLGQVAVRHVAMAEPIAAIVNALNAFNTVVKAHTHIVSGLVTSGAGSGGTVTGVAATSIELAAATVPTLTTAASIGSTTVKVQS